VRLRVAEAQRADGRVGRPAPRAASPTIGSPQMWGKGWYSGSSDWGAYSGEATRSCMPNWREIPLVKVTTRSLRVRVSGRRLIAASIKDTRMMSPVIWAWPAGPGAVPSPAQSPMHIDFRGSGMRPSSRDRRRLPVAARGTRKHGEIVGRDQLRDGGGTTVTWRPWSNPKRLTIHRLRRDVHPAFRFL